MNHDRAHAAQGRAQGHARHAGLGGRHVHHAAGPVFLLQTGGRTEDLLRVRHPQTHQVDARVTRQAEVGRLQNGLGIGQLTVAHD